MLPGIIGINLFKEVAEIELKGKFIKPINLKNTIGAIPLSLMNRTEKALYTFYRQKQEKMQEIESSFYDTRLSDRQIEDLNIDYLEAESIGQIAEELMWQIIYQRLKAWNMSLVLTPDFIIARQPRNEEFEGMLVNKIGHG